MTFGSFSLSVIFSIFIFPSLVSIEEKGTNGRKRKYYEPSSNKIPPNSIVEKKREMHVISFPLCVFFCFLLLFLFSN